MSSVCLSQIWPPPPHTHTNYFAKYQGKKDTVSVAHIKYLTNTCSIYHVVTSLYSSVVFSIGLYTGLSHNAFKAVFRYFSVTNKVVCLYCRVSNMYKTSAQLDMSSSRIYVQCLSVSLSRSYCTPIKRQSMLMDVEQSTNYQTCQVTEYYNEHSMVPCVFPW